MSGATKRPAQVRLRESKAPAASAAGPGSTPSEQLLHKALEEETITDETGRTFHMRKPGPLAQFRMIEALGDLASNQTYMQMTNPLLYLAAINGVPEPQPQTKDEVEALIQRLGHEGLASVMSWYLVNVMGPTQDAIDAAGRAAKDKAALKN